MKEDATPPILEKGSHVPPFFNVDPPGSSVSWLHVSKATNSQISQMLAIELYFPEINQPRREMRLQAQADSCLDPQRPLVVEPQCTCEEAD